MKTASLLIMFIIVLSGCGSGRKTRPDENNSSRGFSPDFVKPGPPTLVYKTKSSYNNLVPVILSDDRSRIVSYPHPKDLFRGDSLSVPFVLHDGYLLDNRGITKNVAFLNITYEDYSRLEAPPDVNKLFDMIIDNDPLTELCDCGNRNSSPGLEGQINGLIDSGTLRIVCRVIK